MAEFNRKKLTSFYFLLALISDMEDATEDIGDWIASIPNGKRDFNCCKKLLNKLATNLFDSIPQEKIRTVKRNVDAMHYRLVFGPQADRDNEAMLVENKDLNCIVEAAMDRCRLCDRKCDKRCSLCVALDSTTSVERPRDASWYDVMTGARG